MKKYHKYLVHLGNLCQIFKLEYEWIPKCVKCSKSTSWYHTKRTRNFSILFHNTIYFETSHMVCVYEKCMT